MPHMVASSAKYQMDISLALEVCHDASIVRRDRGAVTKET